MAKQKLYAVAKGRTVGIFAAWEGPGGVTESIDRFPGAQRRTFEGTDARAQAIRWLVARGAELPPDLLGNFGGAGNADLCHELANLAAMSDQLEPDIRIIAQGRSIEADVS